MLRRFQVIQGGKSSGNSSEERIRLFKAYSLGTLSRREIIYHDVKFNWYCLGRSTGSLPYKEIIADYEHLDEKSKHLFQRDADRYFTAGEIEVLRLYLGEKHNMVLIPEEISLPILERSYLFEEGTSVIYDFLELSERVDYDLPIKVWGYYTLEHCLTSRSMESGIKFLRRALDLLNVNRDFSKSQLENVAKTIFEEDKLLVGSQHENGS